MYLRLLILLLTVTLALSSCCKAICLDDKLQVSFQRFTVRETDTVLYVRYQPVTSEPLDSHWTYTPAAPSLPSTTLSGHTERLDPHFDWQVYLPARARQFNITAIQTGKDRCMCESGNYTTVEGFTINGTPRQGNYVVLE